MDALRLSVAEIAFEDLVLLRVKADDLEGTGFFAGPASGASLFLDEDHSGRRLNRNGRFGTGLIAGCIGTLVTDQWNKGASKGI